MAEEFSGTKMLSHSGQQAGQGNKDGQKGVRDRCRPEDHTSITHPNIHQSVLYQSPGWLPVNQGDKSP